MALQAETLVEEWFNRNGYFTIRGVKEKIDEIDILAVKNIGTNQWNCIHCEVQVSIRPVGYISKLTNKIMKELNAGSKTSAKLRTDSQIHKCASEWVDIKYRSDKKKKIRNLFLNNAEWKYYFVHGNVKDERELMHISRNGVELMSFKDILNQLLTKQTSLDFSGSSAGDLVEIITYLKVK